MKKCPFCAEEIQDDAIKCKHCDEFIDNTIQSYLSEKRVKWYFRRPFIIFALLCVGPFALPLIWLHPHTTRIWKIALTIGILVLSWYLFQATMESINTLEEIYTMTNGM